jgi:hypothetical protein
MLNNSVTQAVLLFHAAGIDVDPNMSAFRLVFLEQPKIERDPVVAARHTAMLNEARNEHVTEESVMASADDDETEDGDRSAYLMVVEQMTDEERAALRRRVLGR